MPGLGRFIASGDWTVPDIWALNAQHGTVLVRGPFGHFAEVHLKDPAMLSGVKVGDQMQVIYTQAVVIELAPAIEPSASSR